MKHIILCADDYGQNATISQAIIDLITKKRLSATSCLTTSPFWLSQATWLASLTHKVDIGLHFNLTEGEALTSPGPGIFSLKSILINTLLRRLNKTAIEAELHAQIDQFVAGLGRLPDFIDGHQHVHQLPMIRDAFINVYKLRFNTKNLPYVRSLKVSGYLFKNFKNLDFKQIVIQFLGAGAFNSQLNLNKIPHNSSFAGTYNFANYEKYALIFIKFLQQIQHNGLIMCHPGLINTQESDPIHIARFHEYQFFMSEHFTKICKLHEIYISPFQPNIA